MLQMIAPLGSGDIDVATGSASATLFNAVARGIPIQIVSGNGNARPAPDGLPGEFGLQLAGDIRQLRRRKTLPDQIHLRQLD